MSTEEAADGASKISDAAGAASNDEGFASQAASGSGVNSANDVGEVSASTGNGDDDGEATSLEDVLVSLPAEQHGAAADAPALKAPGSLKELFLAFTWLALQGFGGVLPVAQRELVERHRWITREQFVEMLSVSQVLPGPNVVNLALMFGDRAFGVRGALTALAGMLLLPMVVVLILTAVYAQYSQIPAVSGALRGMGAVAAGLIIATGFKLLGTLRKSALGVGVSLGLAALMALGTGWMHWPLLWMLLGLGVISCALAWRKLAP